ncbi:Gfo/Idh/MocA family protein [Bacillus mesophilum]|uniref:Gfo/Idh/MocA family oxidoreductase n=1 Tax=Bacillus mesophilum TaxID=1071718 RepID=A0A7V7UW04_9BACI|nr:Gfo/Idh/MocA family oxidoreductase [Bacillus mesophilum]KAB2333429.1 Gfo/Idh/MocA family oxidoreductase [Bacillus mesophilum]
MIKFGVIGTNWITESFLRAAGEIQDFKLQAVFSRTEEKARKFAEQYGASTIFTNLEEMAKSNDIDAVYIATPNSLHAEQAILFLNHQKHVLCEKPIASNAIEFKQMVQAAKENNVLLMEAMKSTYMPVFNEVEKQLERIGQVRKYFASYCQYSSRYDAYKNGQILNAFNPAFSNGSLMDIGVYTIYPLVRLFGKPKEIQASCIKLDTGVDGQGSIIMKYDDKEAVVFFSKIADSNLPAEIQGEKGSIMIDRISSPQKAGIVLRGGDAQDLTVSQTFDPMYYETKAFIDLIKNGETESKINSFKTSLEVLEIMDEARKQMGIVFPADEKAINI